MENKLHSQNKMISSDQIQKISQRSLAIDVFRGISIATMMFVNTGALFDQTPSWSKHPTDYGFTYVDLVAPFFIIAISLTYHISFTKRKEKYGLLQSYLQFIRRYGAFLGFGFLGSPAISTNGIFFTWGVLQAIGFAGLVTLFFINIKKWLRLDIACLFLVIYYFIGNFSLLIDGSSVLISDLIFIDSHGGIIGGIGWAIMMIIATVIGELFKEKRILSIGIFGASFSIIGIISSIFLGISKHRVNFSYISLSIGIGALFLILLWYILEYKELSCCNNSIFRPQGKNSFVLYIIHVIILAITVIIIPETISWGIIIVISLANVVLLWFCAYILDKKKIYLTI